MATVDISDSTVTQDDRNLFGTLVPLSGSATWNPASITTGTSTTTTVTVTGAALGDFTIASFLITTAGCTLSSYVSAADTVTCVLTNNTGGTVDLASSTVYVRVLPRTNVLQA